jgi:CheY-like chemotaxis protein
MRRGKILIVEDELIARENLDHVLKKEGYDTVAVDSGALAFKELEKQDRLRHRIHRGGGHAEGRLSLSAQTLQD